MAVDAKADGGGPSEVGAGATAPRLTKGTEVYCEGRLSLGTWTGRDGAPRGRAQLRGVGRRAVPMWCPVLRRARVPSQGGSGRRCPPNGITAGDMGLGSQPWPGRQTRRLLPA